MLPCERGESGVCVKLTVPALILTLQCGVSDPNKGGDKKADVGRERERGRGNEPPQRVPSAFASLARCVRVCRDYEAASEIENVPTARTLRHTLTNIRTTVIPIFRFY